jgi:methyl-accepting chemotaxis protein
MRKLPLFWKLALLALITPLSIAIESLWVSAGTGRLKTEFDNLYGFMLLPIMDLDRANLLQERISGALVRMAHTEPGAERSALAEQLRQDDAALEKLIAKYRSEWLTTVSPEFTASLASLGKQDMQRREADALQTIESAYREYTRLRAAAGPLQAGVIEAQLARMGGGLEALVAINRDFADISNQTSQSAISWMYRTLAYSGVGLTLIALFVAWTLSRMIIGAVQKLKKAAELLAQGDLSHSVAIEKGDELGTLAESMNAVLATLRELGERAKLVAAGDLSTRIDTKGQLGDPFREMLASLSRLVRQIRDSALQTNASATEILASSQQHQRGASEQASAVEETRRTLEMFISAGKQIAESARKVLTNAETTHRTNQELADRIRKLSAQANRIAEILVVIKEIAVKSEVLALNAALEGTKAGEAGRGFSLVATQMQRLSEQVMASTQDIKDLTTDIRESMSAAVLATEEGTKLAAETTRSAREIGLIVQQQQSSSEQVSKAMEDVSIIARETSTGSAQIVTAVHEMQQLANKLDASVAEFRVEARSNPRASTEAARADA